MKRKYVIHALIESTPAHHCTYYAADIVIEAYTRDEALEQFKERRWELSALPITGGGLYPVGKDCRYTCEPADDDATLTKSRGT